MTRGNYLISCRRCGSLIQAEDKFCGECGANATPVNQDADTTQEVAYSSYASGYVPARSTNNRRALKWSIAVGVLLLLLGGTGALAYATLSPGIDLLGWSNSQSSSTEGSGAAQEEDQKSTSSETTQETTTTASVSSDASPDPAPAPDSSASAPDNTPAPMTPPQQQGVPNGYVLEDCQQGTGATGKTIYYRPPIPPKVEGHGYWFECVHRAGAGAIVNVGSSASSGVSPG